MKTWTALVLAALLQLGTLGSFAADASAPPAPTPAPPEKAAPSSSPFPTLAPLAALQETGESQLFSIAMVQADNSSSGSGKLPPVLEKAIADVQDFLPYTSFRLLDSGLTRTQRQGTLILRGEGEAEYRVNLALARVRSDPGSSFLFESFTVSVPKTTLLSASFRVDRGETVVVGSARLESGKGAIIVLVTAVP